jgi:hypothetical protein
VSTPADQLSVDRSALLAQRGAQPPGPSEADVVSQKTADIAPDQARLSGAYSDAAAVKPPGAAQLPETPKKPLVDPGEYQKLSGALVAMALIAGSVSRGNWYGVSHSLNGALKGYLEGNEQRADQDWKKYQADFDKALEKHKEQQQDYTATLENKKLTINQIFNEIQTKAAKWDDQALLARAREKRFDEMTKQIYGMDEKREQLTLQRRNIDSEIASRASKMGGGLDDPKVRGVYAAMSDAGISFPPGMRSVKAQNETIKGLIEAHPNDSPADIAARVKAGELDVKEKTTELGVVARREGSSASAINALNRQGGLYDQLTETAKKVDFGSSKFASNLELWKQGKAVADPDISEYVNALSDTRAEFASVLARGGQVTDSVRIASEHAFPDNLSFAELQRNVERSKKIADSIQAGNTSVADALIHGKSMEEALKSGGMADAAHPPEIQSLLDKYK